jgi:hypothetical protein
VDWIEVDEDLHYLLSLSSFPLSSRLWVTTWFVWCEESKTNYFSPNFPHFTYTSLPILFPIGIGLLSLTFFLIIRETGTKRNNEEINSQKQCDQVERIYWGQEETNEFVTITLYSI